MLSMPPAMAMEARPAAIWSAAIITAFMPEPHILLIVVAGTSNGTPAKTAAWRAGAWPRPAGNTQPITVSSMSAAGIPERLTASPIAAAPSWGAASAESSPWKPPMGVRAPASMTISCTAMSLDSLGLSLSRNGTIPMTGAERWVIINDKSAPAARGNGGHEETAAGCGDRVGRGASAPGRLSRRTQCRHPSATRPGGGRFRGACLRRRGRAVRAGHDGPAGIPQRPCRAAAERGSGQGIHLFFPRARDASDFGAAGHVGGRNARALRRRLQGAAREDDQSDHRHAEGLAEETFRDDHAAAAFRGAETL